MHLPKRLMATLSGWRDDAAGSWIAALPGIIAAAEERWGIQIADPFEPGGATSWVAPAVTSDGACVVYKCTLPHPEAIGEADALETYAGDGAVRLIASEPETFELLVERCTPGSDLWERPDRERIEAVSSLMRRLWRKAPPRRFGDLGSLTSRWSAVTARRLMTLEVPWDTRPIERGVDLLQTLSLGTATPVLLHQDLHPGNVLAAEREPWLVIDPKPVVGDPAFEPVQLLVQQAGRIGEPPGPDGVQARLELIAGAVDLDPTRIGLFALARCAEWSMWSYERGNIIDAAIEYTWARTLDTILPT